MCDATRLRLSIVAFLALSMCATPSSSAAQDVPRLVLQLGYTGVSVYTAAFSPDGQLLVTAGGETAKLWEVETGRELRAFVGHVGEVIGVAFSPDGRFVLTGGADHAARLWDARTGESIRSFSGHKDSVVRVAFSPDGKRVLTGSDDNTAKLWDAETGRMLRTFAGHLNAGKGMFPNRVRGVAFSPDGKRVLTGGDDKTARLWDADSGRELRRFVGHTGRVSSVVFSPDGQRVMTGGTDDTARIWDANSGRQVHTFTGHGRAVNCVTFSSDDRWALTGSDDGTVKLWNTTSGAQVRTFAEQPGKITSVTFSPDGRGVLTTADDSTVRLWDADQNHELRTFRGYSGAIRGAVFSADGRRIQTASLESAVELWDGETGRQLQRFALPLSNGFTSVAFSADARLALTGGFDDNTARLWDAETGRLLRTFQGTVKRFETAVINDVAFSPDRKYVLVGGRDNVATLWNTATGERVRTFAGGSAVQSSVEAVAFSADGSQVLMSDGTLSNGTAKLWDVATGGLVRTFEEPAFVTSVAISPDGRHVLIGSGPAARLRDATNGQLLRTFSGHTSRVTQVAFSPDGRRALTASADHTAKLWDAETGQSLRTFAGHTDSVSRIAFSPDGRHVLTGSNDHTTRLWNAETGAELCTLISFDDGTWAVVTPDGRFDTDNLDGNPGLHWVMPDDPLHALPLEVFMRDYYEPGLLRRVLAGDRLPAVASLLNVNRVQPAVAVTRIEPTAADPGLVDVTVKVSSAQRAFQRNGSSVTMTTGVYDVRLFRDGQIVDEWPIPERDASPGARRHGAESLAAWRKAAAVTLDATGSGEITFTSIKLPRQQSANPVEFAAYAFNDDRVKSETSRRKYEVPNTLSTLKGRAYLVTIGVNLTENPAFDLRFAAADAAALSDVLHKNLSQVGDFADIIRIPLISDYEMKDGVKVPISTTATKANVKAVLDLLAGRRVDSDAMGRVPNAASIKPARPEDLLVISLSSHGYADAQGNFYFLPYDIGTGTQGGITPGILEHAIASDELTDWLRAVDAGQIAIIVDACHSAATIEAEGFKPGPMGSRGLGQLAYDKRIKIVTASQAADVAWEYDTLQHGLLTFALVTDGLVRGQADYKPRDGEVKLAEWLAFGTGRVPQLDQAIREGRLEGLTTATRGLALVANSPRLQQPVLFDFARSNAGPTIAR